MIKIACWARFLAGNSLQVSVERRSREPSGKRTLARSIRIGSTELRNGTFRGDMSDQNQARRLFLGCFWALVATAFAFALRGNVLDDIGVQFGLSEEEKGILIGVGVFPF